MRQIRATIIFHDESGNLISELDVQAENLNHAECIAEEIIEENYDGDDNMFYEVI